MDINTHIKQGILHYLLIAGKHPHVQSLFPQKGLSDHDLLDILFYKSYSRLSKESRFFFTTISVFCCGNYGPVESVQVPDKIDAGQTTPTPEPIKTTIAASDDSIEDMLNGAMPK